MRSYALIMANTDYIQFFLTDVEVAVDGDAALVTCTENILTGGPAEEDGSAGALVGGLVVATNVFRRTSDGWRLWSHHGSPVLAEDDDEDGRRRRRRHRHDGRRGRPRPTQRGRPTRNGLDGSKRPTA